MFLKKKISLLTLTFFAGCCFAQNNDKLTRLKVSDNGHFLQYEDNRPFFWLGDTGWYLFLRLTREEIDKYLANRQKKGFNVIQAAILRGHANKPNQYGDIPFEQMDPEKPNEKYFQLVDYTVQKALEKNMFMGLLPTWGDMVSNLFKSGTIIFNEKNAYAYGLFLGKRYKDYPNIIWISGGDQPAFTDKGDWRPVWRAMIKGIREGTNGKALVTYHPWGKHSSTEFWNEEAILDFNMLQSGHEKHDEPVWDWINRDYHRTPVKPILDGEPNYEDHAVNWKVEEGYFRDYDVRKQIYRSVFSGACGVTYGHMSIRQFYSPRERPMGFPDRYWIEGMDRPGAFQAGYLKDLILSRPSLNRIPDQSIIKTGQGEKGKYMTAFRDGNNNYAMVYMPVGRSVTMDVSWMRGDQVVATWFNPRTAETSKIGVFEKKSTLQFTPPTRGVENDWVLILDNAQATPVLAIQDTRFTLDDQPFDFMGISFFNAVYNPAFNKGEKEQLQWLQKFKSYGITVLRIWAEWNNDLGFVDAADSCTLYNRDGSLKPLYISRLKTLLSNAGSQGMVIELALFSSESKGKKLLDDAADKAVRNITEVLKPYRNIAFQVWNEFDYRALDYFKIIKQYDPARIVSNSPGGGGTLGNDEENSMLDYLSPHTTRQGRHWEKAAEEVKALIAKFKKPVVDDEPARNGTPKFGGPEDGSHPTDQILHTYNIWKAGGHPIYHHDMFQMGKGSQSVPPHGIPDPEFSEYHKVVFEFLKHHKRYNHSGVQNKFIRISSKSNAYFATGNDKTWVPVMINYIVPFGQEESKAMATIESYFKDFSQNGGNAMRIWISSPFLEIEDEKAGQYNPVKFQRIDKIVGLAKQYYIRIKFTLQHIRTIASGKVRNAWANSSVLHVDSGGPFRNISEYINSPEGRRYYLNRVRALAGRYSNNDQIFGWELWNEMDAVDEKDWNAFSRDILDSVKALFPRHLVTQTLGSLHSEDAAKRYEQFFTLSHNPYISLHRYIDPGTAWQQYDKVTRPVDSLVYDAVQFARSRVHDRPVVVNEIGAVEANHAGPSKLYLVDTAGMLIHDMIFAPFFCGAAGTGGLWHWDSYVQRQNLWYHYQRFQNAIKGIDPAREQFTPYTFKKNKVGMYGLKGRNQTIIWCRSTENNWKTELRDKIPPAVIADCSLQIEETGRTNPKTAKVYDPWKDKWTTLSIKNSNISLPSFSRSLIVIIK